MSRTALHIHECVCCQTTVTSAGTGQKKAVVQKARSETEDSESSESDDRHKAKPVTTDRKSMGKVLIFIMLVNVVVLRL